MTRGGLPRKKRRKGIESEHLESQKGDTTSLGKRGYRAQGKSLIGKMDRRGDGVVAPPNGVAMGVSKRGMETYPHPKLRERCIQKSFRREVSARG